MGVEGREGGREGEEERGEGEKPVQHRSGQHTPMEGVNRGGVGWIMVFKTKPKQQTADNLHWAGRDFETQDGEGRRAETTLNKRY